MKSVNLGTNSTWAAGSVMLALSVWLSAGDSAIGGGSPNSGTTGWAPPRPQSCHWNGSFCEGNCPAAIPICGLDPASAQCVCY